MIILLLSLVSFANELPGESLWVAPKEAQVQSKPTQPSHVSSGAKKKLNAARSSKGDSSEGNIPKEYLASIHRESNASELIQPPKGSSELFRGLKVGAIVDVQVPHSVVAFPDEKAPVIGEGDSGVLSGFKFVGESYLEPNTRRIFVNFSRLIIGHQIYNFKGVGVSSAGQPGITGEYHSREAEYFTGDFIASFAAGYFDGLVPRRTNVFGQTETDPSVDNSVKKGLASGALSTADRFKEKLKKVPEFAEVKGPFNLRILVLEQAKATN